MYVDGAKLASVGLRVRRGSSYHGLALNVTVDLEPFRRINVCGYPGLGVTRLEDLVPGCDMDSAARGIVPHLLRNSVLRPRQPRRLPRPPRLVTAPSAPPCRR